MNSVQRRVWPALTEDAEVLLQPGISQGRAGIGCLTKFHVDNDSLPAINALMPVDKAINNVINSKSVPAPIDDFFLLVNQQFRFTDRDGKEIGNLNDSLRLGMPKRHQQWSGWH